MLLSDNRQLIEEDYDKFIVVEQVLARHGDNIHKPCIFYSCGDWTVGQFPF